ncbi:hypothetical protein ACQEV2_40865 [Streptomyces sp. CA-251387]|uniref:hypothetical protein n=1 Tax=Streptomyces sp. CA-251387 TaxID=3240064 RepID=UPI003D9214C0
MIKRERGNTNSGCRRLARLLEETVERGAAVRREQPRVVCVGTGRRAAGRQSAAADFVERLPAAAVPWSWRGASPASTVTPAGAGRLDHLTHHAVGLAEVARVQDVVDLVADQITPTYGARGLAHPSPTSTRTWGTSTRC